MNELPEWKLYSLEFDEAGQALGEFFHEEGQGITRINSGEITKSDVRKLIEKSLLQRLDSDKRAMVVYGDGRYHHYTYGLCRFADRFSDDYCYIHIDHHHDFLESSYSASLDCGNFTGHIARHCNVHGPRKPKNMIYIGSDPGKTWGFLRRKKMTHFLEGELRQEPSLKRKGGMKKFERILRDTPKHCYVTIDLDVMAENELITSYGRGTLTRKELSDILELIKETKEIIGADALGYTHYSSTYSTICKRESAASSCPLVKHRALSLYKLIVDSITNKNNGGKK